MVSSRFSSPLEDLNDSSQEENLLSEERESANPSISGKAKVPRRNIFDVAIIGAGYAGLASALVLGRYTIPTVVFNGGRPRNWDTSEVHGFLGSEGVSPKTLWRKARNQALGYSSVKLVNARVVSVERRELPSYDDEEKNPDALPFTLETASGEMFSSKFLILATGVVDVKPHIKNFSRFYGKGIWHCPHCDGFETRGRKLGILASSEEAGIEFAKEFLGWTRDITLFIQQEGAEAKRGRKEKEKEEEEKKHAGELGFQIIRGDPAIKVLASRGKIRGLESTSGRKIPVQVIFFNLGVEIQNQLARKVGCELDQGYASVCHDQETSVPRVYAVGDLDTDRHYVSFAVASGARAAISIYEHVLRAAIKVVVEKEEEEYSRRKQDEKPEANTETG